jgi:hypothetical protein
MEHIEDEPQVQLATRIPKNYTAAYAALREFRDLAKGLRHHGAVGEAGVGERSG